jgi:hypothetical protein
MAIERAYVELAANVGLQSRLQPRHPREVLPDEGRRVVPVEARREQVLIDQVAPAEAEDLEPNRQYVARWRNLLLPRQLT